MLSVGIFVISLLFSSPIQAKQKPSTSDELLQYAIEQNINIMLYDENGKLIRNFMQMDLRSPTNTKMVK